MTKRLAILAIFSGVLAKLAHADDPNWKPSKPPAEANSSVGLNWRQEPLIWTVNLDMMKQLDVMLDGKTVTISAADIFTALSS